MTRVQRYARAGPQRPPRLPNASPSRRRSRGRPPGYSGDGNAVTITDANGNLTTNAYDGYNRLSSVTFPSIAKGSGTSNPADVESYAYDNNSNRTGLTKRDGTAIAFAYDTLNRVTAKTFPAGPSPNVEYCYDLAGRPTVTLYASACPRTPGTSGVVWTYDSAGRRTGEATNGRALTFTYDAAGNETSITWPDGGSSGYIYDSANRLTVSVVPSPPFAS